MRRQEHSYPVSLQTARSPAGKAAEMRASSVPQSGSPQEQLLRRTESTGCVRGCYQRSREPRDVAGHGHESSSSTHQSLRQSPRSWEECWPVPLLQSPENRSAHRESCPSHHPSHSGEGFLMSTSSYNSHTHQTSEVTCPLLLITIN